MTSHSTSRRALCVCSSIAVLFASACSKGDSGTPPPTPAAVQAAQSSGLTATVGTALATAPTFTVTDASGNPLGNVSVSVAVASGGGSLAGAPTKSSAGATSVGTWTLGTTAGSNSLTITVSGLSPLTISATGTPGSPAKVVVSAGNAQTALAGAQVGTPLAAAVQDQYNNGIANLQVTFAATAGGGSIAPAVLTTSSSGVASGAIWRLGNRGGTQTATATAGAFSTTFSATIQSNFPIDLRFYGPAMSTEAQTAFQNAANRLRAAIVNPLSDVALGGIVPAACADSAHGVFVGLPSTALGASEHTTGVVIYASVRAIDGARNILAQAGPCWSRTSNELPVIGAMEFDSADLASLIAQGTLESVVLHEMNHVLGFGTVWPYKSLLQNPAWTTAVPAVATGSTNPRFVGPAATNSCLSAGGTSNHCTLGAGVAVEACGGDGTADGHWREVFPAACPSSGKPTGLSAFTTELMTGWASSTPDMAWSAMSIASFQDLGYTVNLGAADNFSVPSLIALARMSLQSESGEQPIEVLRRPQFTITSTGRVQPILRGAK